MNRQELTAKLKQIRESFLDKENPFNYYPWEGEPDEYSWEAYGLPCWMKRGPQGYWCGYVGVKQGHPLYGKGVWEIERYFEVHGGVTWGGEFLEEDDTWWIGFDCGHACDLTPQELVEAFYFPLGKPYRDFDYVKAETEKLARQVADNRLLEGKKDELNI